VPIYAKESYLLKIFFYLLAIRQLLRLGQAPEIVHLRRAMVQLIATLLQWF
jgi:hypothetical protein